MEVWILKIWGENWALGCVGPGVDLGITDFEEMITVHLVSSLAVFKGQKYWENGQNVEWFWKNIDWLNWPKFKLLFLPMTSIWYTKLKPKQNLYLSCIGNWGYVWWPPNPVNEIAVWRVALVHDCPSLMQLCTTSQSDSVYVPRINSWLCNALIDAVLKAVNYLTVL